VRHGVELGSWAERKILSLSLEGSRWTEGLDPGSCHQTISMDPQRTEVNHPPAQRKEAGGRGATRRTRCVGVRGKRMSGNRSDVEAIGCALWSGGTAAMRAVIRWNRTSLRIATPGEMVAIGGWMAPRGTLDENPAPRTQKSVRPARNSRGSHVRAARCRRGSPRARRPGASGGLRRALAPASAAGLPSGVVEQRPKGGGAGRRIAPGVAGVGVRAAAVPQVGRGGVRPLLAAARRRKRSAIGCRRSTGEY